MTITSGTEIMCSQLRLGVCDMKEMYLFTVLKSNYCKLVLVLSLFVAYMLIPSTVFTGWYTLLAGAFAIAFPLSMMCMIRLIKERAKAASTYSGSAIGLIASIIGLSALQVCGVGAPVCGASLGLGVLSAIFPGVFVNVLEGYSTWFLLLAVISQVASLYFMKCFSKPSAAAPVSFKLG